MDKKEERKKGAVNTARKIMATLLGGAKVVFPRREPRVDRCEAKRRARFAHIPPRSARRESLKRFRRRNWGHRSLAYVTARGREGRRRKRAIIKSWWRDEKRERARQRAGRV